MDCGVQIGTAVFDHNEAEILIRSFDQSGENDAACGDTEKDKRVNVVRAEDHGEVGASERAYAMLGNDNFAFFRGDCGGDCC